MIDGINFFDKPVKNDLIKYATFGRLQLVNEIITQLAVCSIIIIL